MAARVIWGLAAAEPAVPLAPSRRLVPCVNRCSLATQAGAFSLAARWRRPGGLVNLGVQAAARPRKSELETPQLVPI